MKSCCFTGHRQITGGKEIADKLESVLTELIEKGVTEFYAGGALGWDTVCAKTVLKLRESFGQIKLHLLLPCPPNEQTKSWTEEQKAEYGRIIEAADSVETVSPKYTVDCMKKRNARLAEMGDICVCYYREARRRSGTGQTVNMVKRLGKEIINLIEN